MATVRVQYRRRLAGSPLIGKWQVYTKAYFSTATTTPTSAVQAQLVRLFSGMSTSAGATITSTFTMDTSANAAQLSVHEFTGGALVHLADYVQTQPAIQPTATQYLPSQAALAIGYRSAAGATPQFGRSRWWLGPLGIGSTDLDIASSGGMRLSHAGVDKAASHAAGCLGALTALGWTLVVKHGSGGGTTFGTAVELYVDDIIDVMRSRRTWQNYQKRTIL